MTLIMDTKPEIEPVLTPKPAVATQLPFVVKTSEQPASDAAPIETQEEASSPAVKTVTRKRVQREKSCECSNKKKYLIFTGIFLGGLIIGKNI